MTLKGGASGACAACKYQRRRCATDCPLAPYFPPEQPRLFQNVHKLFGVSSIIKILNKLDPSQRPEAMKSIIFQSYVRERSPVHGCLGITQHLQYLIWLAEEELRHVNSQLQRCRQQHNLPTTTTNNIDHHISTEFSDNNDVTSQLDLGMALSVKSNHSSSFPVYSPLSASQITQQQLQSQQQAEQPQPQQQQQAQQQPQQQQISYSHSCSDANGYSSAYTDAREDMTTTFCNHQYPYA